MRTALLTIGLLIAQAMQAQTIAPDPSFNVDGVAYTDFGTVSQPGWDACLQPDGKIVVAGSSGTNSLHDVAVVRYLPDGNLDPTFSGDGRVTTAVGVWSDLGKAVALQPDGKILVAGTFHNPTRGDFLLIRYLPDGILDTSFGAGGIASTDIWNDDDIVEDMVLQPDGKILLAGWAQDTLNDEDIALARFHPDGSLDSTFGGDGTVRFPHFFRQRANAMALQPDGRIVVTGTQELNFDYDIITVRFLADGTLDNSFGGGPVITDMAGGDEHANAVVVQADGRIAVSGWTSNPGYLTVLRYNTDGTLDNTFSGDGIDTSAGFAADGTAIVVQNDTCLLVGGSANTGLGWANLALARYLPGGGLDTTFNGSGSYQYQLPTGASVGRNALLVQPNDRIVMAGTAYFQTESHFFAARFWNGPQAGVQELPPRTATLSVHPTPAVDDAVIEYTVATTGTIRLELYDALGAHIRTLIAGVLRTAGTHREAIELTPLAAGSYTLVLTTPTERGSLTMVKM